MHSSNDTPVTPLPFLGHRAGQPVFRIAEDKVNAWKEILRLEGFKGTVEGQSSTVWATFNGSYQIIEDPGKVLIRVNPPLSGHAFHRIGLRRGMVTPTSKRDRKYLANLQGPVECPYCGGQMYLQNAHCIDCGGQL